MWLIGLSSVELSNLRTRDLSCCGMQAASLRVAEQYIQAFGNIAKEGTTMLLPSSAANPANMIAQALTMYKSLVPNGGIQETSVVESSSKAK
ncbi:hypothetical protein DY000_02001393 [Brassica cretica]|uniref:STML2-like C-terminal extension domain-containing protein n=1 Tax=Brassica cretica TaxID=69181 RepID=A0ABQ7BZU3_BRACR|nr:hypothetical protein DY000_02001393 [Brassica cretica]